MKKEQNELDILLPESEVIINGEVIEIKPFPFAKLPKVIKLLSKMGTGIYAMFANDILKFTEEGDVIVNQVFIESVGAVVDEHFPEVVELISVYTGRTAEFYIDEQNGFTAEDGLMLLAGIIERNYDFFMKRLTSAMPTVQAKLKQLGPRL